MRTSRKIFCLALLLAATAAILSAQGRRGARGAAGAAPGRAPAYPTRQEDPALVAQGKQIFEANCSFCHGSDARGGETGPNLVRAQVVLDDRNGEKIAPIVENGLPGPPVMPKFPLSPADISAVAAFIHSQPLGNRGAPSNLDILVGNADAGKTYFNGAGKCATCHSVTCDLAGIGAKYDPKQLQNLIVSGGAAAGGFGRGPAGPPPPPTTVTVKLASGQTVEGKLGRIDAFNVSLTESDGTYRSFSREGPNPPTVTVHDPLQPHTDMLPHWNDTDLHNLTAYLTTVK